MSTSPPASGAELRRRALALLARREHSRAELAAKLARHAGSEAALGRLLDALERRGELSDARYAEARARALARKYGAERIRHELRARGVDDALASRAVPGDELGRARAILARRYRTPAATLAERARRARFLRSRGFSFDTIRRALAVPGTDPD